MKKLAVLLLMTTVAACGGGGGSAGEVGSPAPPITPTPGPTPSPSPAPSPAPSPSPSPTPSAPLGLAQQYSVTPDIATCRPGQMSAAARAEVLASVNTIRALHALPAVTYSVADEPEAMAASLIMTANGQLSHTPSPSWLCYTSLGANGAGSSNIYGGSASSLSLFQPNDRIMAGWMTEVDNLIANNVGHRRWILDPFLTTVSYGRVAVAANGGLADSAALKVFGFSAAPAVSGTLPAFVAYPQGDYPDRYFDSRALLSFGVISNPTVKFANTNVDYSQATVTVRQRGGASLPVSNVSHDTQGYGLPNNLQFNVDGLAGNTFYDVTIANVRVGGTPRTYDYSFRIVS